MTAPLGVILVVDDNATNLELLVDILQLEGHAVRTAAGGNDALARVLDIAPDLILLDVNMPGVDGLEVCRRLRGDPRTASIPVILVTSLTNREHRLEGIAAGANDYLTKPVDRTDLLLRVRNALHLRGLHRELTAQYEHLSRVERLRDDLVHMLVHDLRSPLTGISLTVDLLRGAVAESADAALRDDLDAIGRSIRQMAAMVNNVLDVSRLEAEALPLRKTAVDLAALAQGASASVALPGRQVVVRPGPPGVVVPAWGDAEIITRIIANLVGNALKFSPAGAPVVVELAPAGEGAVVRVSDHGPGVDPARREAIFEKFGQAEAPRGARSDSSGLGLAFCKLAVEAHGGRIGVESTPGEGSVFWFTLPGPQGAFEG